MYFSKKYRKSSGRGLPYVNFNDCNELELKLIDWLGNDKLINESMGLLVLRLHILHEEENLIEFCNYNKEDNSFKCIINEKDIYDIKINNLNDKYKNKEIVVSRDDTEYTYLCEPVMNIELGMRITLSSYKKNCLYGLVKLTHYLSRDYVILDIDYMGYNLRLKVLKPKDLILPMFDSNGRYSKYRLESEEELISYLINLMPPFSLVDIYEVLREISLGNDIGIYPEVYLEISKNNKDNEKKITDLIHLRNGEIEKFGLTRVDTSKTLFLNKDGSWEYQCLDEECLVDFSMNVNGSKINYNVCIDEDMDIDVSRKFIRDNIESARCEIENVKVLSRKLFNNNTK